ncbi:glycosyltransferase [Shimia sp. NS0008-38b]
MINSNDMQVIGLCRFSYPALGGFQVEHETIEDRIDFLYQETRLEERFQLMETVALPCLKAQTDQNFEMILVIGDTLPKHHVDRLHDITANIPQIRIVAHPPKPHRPLMKELINGARKDPKAPCLQFRHDDDDAISVDFFEQLRAATNAVSGLLETNKTVAFDWNRGHIAEMTGDGIAATDTVRNLYVASLGMYVRGGCPLTIMNFRHGIMNQFMPTISFTDTPMWVRTHNGYNDSRQKKVKPVPVVPLTKQQEAEFSARFAIDADQVRSTFS